jgi:hypothetical protein
LSTGRVRTACSQLVELQDKAQLNKFQIHAKMANLRLNEDYHKYFDPKIYLGQFYKKLRGDENDYPSTVPLIKAFHEF